MLLHCLPPVGRHPEVGCDMQASDSHVAAHYRTTATISDACVPLLSFSPASIAGITRRMSLEAFAYARLPVPSVGIGGRSQYRLRVGHPSSRPSCHTCASWQSAAEESVCRIDTGQGGSAADPLVDVAAEHQKCISHSRSKDVSTTTQAERFSSGTPSVCPLPATMLKPY